MNMIAMAFLALMAAQDPDVDALLDRLSDDSIEVRERTLKELIELGVKAEARVRARMESSQGELRQLCERILAKYARQKKVDSVLPPLKRVTIDAKDRKLKDVLLEIQRQSGVPLQIAELQDAPITLHVKDATPLEAVTAVCKAAGLGYSISAFQPSKDGRPPVKTDPAVWLNSEGFADAPRRFVGHFVVECARVHLTRRTRFDFVSLMSSLGLRIMWPPDVRPDTAFLDIASVHDERGRLLYEKPRYAEFGQAGRGLMPGEVRYSTESGVEFKFPGEEVEKVSVRGTALILFAGEDRYITFDSPGKSLGHRKEMADMSVELRNLKEADGETVVTIAFTGRPKNPVPRMGITMGGLGSRYFQVRLNDGTSVVCNNTVSRSEGPVQVMDLNFRGLPSKITAVDVLAETAYHEERFDFELKDIPLPK